MAKTSYCLIRLNEMNLVNELNLFFNILTKKFTDTIVISTDNILKALKKQLTETNSDIHLYTEVNESKFVNKYNGYYSYN